MALSQVDDGANASYNALLLSENHRLSKNFSVLVNYTWSHCVGDGDGDVQSEITGATRTRPAALLIGETVSSTSGTFLMHP
jgi:hypothetical protein